MKNIVRLFALSLVATGAVATAHIAGMSQTAAPAQLSAMPTPTCPPDDPNGCGIKQFGK